MSRTKGAGGERELCRALTDAGFPAHRTAPMQSGAEGYGDVTAQGLETYHIEAKRCERVEVDRWFAEASEKAGERTPVVVYRKNGNPWRVVLDLPTFLSLNGPEAP